MRVEFIGCTSAGKSTLITALRQAAPVAPEEVLTSYEFVLQRCGMGWVQPHKVRMAVLNGIALIAALIDVQTNARAIGFAITYLMQQRALLSVRTRLNLLRLVMRNLGIDSLLRWFDHAGQPHQQWILADEGVLQSAHYLFVHLAITPNVEALHTWLTLVTLPDVVVHLRPERALLIERICQRGHGRIAQPTTAKVTQFVDHALAVFDALAQEPTLQSRTIHVAQSITTAGIDCGGIIQGDNQEQNRDRLWQAMKSVNREPSLDHHPALRDTNPTVPYPNNRGAIIAFVGPEATGKSTLVAATTAWLQQTTSVRSVHVGKPAASWITFPLQLFVPLLRKLLPHWRTTRRERAAHRESNESTGQSSVEEERSAADLVQGQPVNLADLVYALRAVSVAYDRYRLLKRVQRWVNQGEIVVCDRYPSEIVGAMDSPRLRQRLAKQHPAQPQDRLSPSRQMVTWLYDRLARLESACYQRMPQADIVIRLTVSLVVAQERNRQRIKEETVDEEYMATRRNKAARSSVAGCFATHTIDTDATLASTIDSVQQVIGQSLHHLFSQSSSPTLAVNVNGVRPIFGDYTEGQN